MKTKFSSEQRTALLMCFLSYATAYVGRLNLSAALNSLMKDASLTEVQGGMFQTVFALTYAVGQMVNGSIVDRVSARAYIVIGLFASALCNCALSLCTGFNAMIVVWALNGVAQSMLWTPVVKLMTVWFKGEQRDRASFVISFTLVLGHLSAWAISGGVASVFSWRYSFRIPAAIVATVAVLDFLFLKDGPKAEAVQRRNTKAKIEGQMPIKPLILTTGLIPLLVLCVFNGFIRDGIISWAPTILANMDGNINSTLVSLVIPILNLIGILIGKLVYHKLGKNARKCAGMLMTVSAMLALLLIPVKALIIPFALMLGLTCAANYGINPILTTFVPMEYYNVKRVALIAGIVDCFIYLGSSLSGVVTGVVSGSAGWNMVFIMWCAVAVGGGFFSVLSLRGRKNLGIEA